MIVFFVWVFYLRNNLRGGILLAEMVLKTGERIDDLLRQELKIIQNPASFCFSMDAVLLANFATVKSNDNVIDLGTGSGVIPLLLASRQKRLKVTGLELQAEVADRAQRSVQLNNLTETIKITQGDLKQVEELLPLGQADLVTCNPPYMSTGHGLLNELDSMAIARHEIKCTLEDVIRAGSKLLTFKGRMAVVHKPHRLVDIFYLMRQYKIEPKRLRLVYPRPGRKCNMVLVEGLLGGGVELEVLEPLFIYGADGQYTEELLSIYYPLA